MKRPFLVPLAFLLAAPAYAAPPGPPVTEPVDVIVTNPVVQVEVSNANPVPVSGLVTSADNPALQAVTLNFNAEILTTKVGPNFLTSDSVYTVPDGKRLVIEYIDASLYVTPSSNTGKASFAVYGYDAVAGFRHPLGIVSESINCTLSQVCWYLSTPLKIYFDAGMQIYAESVFDVTQAGYNSFVRGTLNGYLVDLP